MTNNLRKVSDFLGINALRRPLKSDSNDEAVADDRDSNKAEIGFKVAYSSYDLKVKLLSARNLPPCYGNNKSRGYLTKITLHPDKEKFETEIVRKETSPVFNQEFTFALNRCGMTKRSADGGDPFKGKFLAFTVYAVLDADKEGNARDSSGLRRSRSLRDRFKSILTLNGSQEDETNGDFSRGSGFRGSYRPRSLNTISFNNRRLVGSVTYYLDRKSFTLKLKNNYHATPDIWRPISSITAGCGQMESQSSKKNASVEIIIDYSSSEDGNNESIMISLTRFRCSMQTMQQYERIGGNLYFKLTVWQNDRLLTKWKSGKFEPTISMKIESNTATSNVIFKRLYIDEIRIVLRLMCKNVIGKKTLLGSIVIDKDAEVWRRIVENPSTAVTETFNFD